MGLATGLDPITGAPRPYSDLVEEAIQQAMRSYPVGLAEPTAPGHSAKTVEFDADYEKLATDLDKTRAHSRHLTGTVGAPASVRCGECGQEVTCDALIELGDQYEVLRPVK